MIKELTTTSVKETKVVSQIEVKALVSFLREQGVIPKEAKDVALTVDVPGGGDWSGTRLGLGDDRFADSVLKLRYTHIEEETK